MNIIYLTHVVFMHASILQLWRLHVVFFFCCWCWLSIILGILQVAPTTLNNASRYWRCWLSTILGILQVAPTTLNNASRYWRCWLSIILGILQVAPTTLNNASRYWRCWLSIILGILQVAPNTLNNANRYWKCFLIKAFIVWIILELVLQNNLVKDVLVNWLISSSLLRTRAHVWLWVCVGVCRCVCFMQYKMFPLTLAIKRRSQCKKGYKIIIIIPHL